MGKFKPGQSGNPRGKKIGTTSKKTQLAKLLEPHAQDLIQKAVELALEGDSQALRLCIERIIPKAKEPVIKVVIPDTTNKDIEQITKEMFCSLSGQELSITEVRQLVSVVHDDFAYVKHNEETLLEMRETLKALTQKYEREY